MSIETKKIPNYGENTKLVLSS